jgi:hypothetical protein
MGKTSEQHEGVVTMAKQIIGYRFGRDILCGADMMKELPTGPEQEFDGWADATGTMGAEEFLDGIAQAFGIDRDAELYSADEFPKVVLAEEAPVVCDRCSKMLG